MNGSLVSIMRNLVAYIEEAKDDDYPSGSLFLLSKGPLHEDIKTHKNALVVHEM